MQDTDHFPREALTSVCKAVGQDFLRSTIYLFLKTLASDEQEEDNRVEALTLFKELSGAFGVELCEELLVPLLPPAAVDPSFRVRKVIHVLGVSHVIF